MTMSECPNVNPECRYANQSCFMDTHHLYYPRRQYRSAIDKEYRELPAHKVQMCRAEHDELHATERPPTKPPREEMLRAIASQAIREMGYESDVDRG